MTQTQRDPINTSSTQPATKAVDSAADYLRSHDAIEIADDAREKAQQVADDVQEKAAQLGNQATEQINSAMSSAGQQLNTLAQTVRERAPDTQVRDLADTTASALERSGTYLENANVDMIRRDLEAVIRNHPVEAVAIGLGLGFLLARSMRR